ncbi:recombination protein RecR [Sulfurimonas sp. MAG313]|nr:recombination mediator RecR [Sulfurimonas sp. MAG313]MDF1881349.1 recombination protein RecR [Sulfurimonas sp. MAG313]
MKRGLEKFNILVESLEALPSIGKKSATRMAYHMVMQDNFSAIKIAHAIENALGSLRKCIECGGLCEDELCGVCSDDSRDTELLCVVENAKDILTLEEGGIFDGKYFVLENLDHFDSSHLVDMVNAGVKEIVFALTPSIANDAVMLFIEDKLSVCDVNFTRIAQGVPTGVSLENIDLLSLSRALEDRVKV